MAFENIITDENVPRTYDAQRDIAFYYKFVPIDTTHPPDHFFLKWHGKKIVIQCHNKASDEGIKVGENEWVFDKDWVISSIAVPKDFPESQETIAETIKSAFKAYGSFYDTSIVRNLSVTVEPGAFRVKEDWEYD